MRERIIISILSVITIITVDGANSSTVTQRDTIGTFSLGEITCIGYRPVEGVNSFTANQIQRHDVHTIEDALNLMPSLTVRDAGSRGEGIFYLRGFDQRRVPVLLDGVPIYIPFESTLDIRRLSTSNLSKIIIEKGAPSILAGINAMGGTVNLVSSKPIEKFELDASVSTLYDANLSIGSAHKSWYAQASISYDKRDFIRLPHSFKYIEGVQESRHLVNSDRKDMTVNAPVGLTLADDEYAVGYTMIRANKGVPVYLGQKGKLRFWRYDPWDKDEILIHTRTVTESAGTFETRLFFTNADWILYSRASSTSDGSLWVPGFGVINVRANKSFLDRHLIVEGGIRNVFDKLYYYTEGYPQEVRVFYAAIRYDFRIR